MEVSNRPNILIVANSREWRENCGLRIIVSVQQLLEEELPNQKITRNILHPDEDGILRAGDVQEGVVILAMHHSRSEQATPSWLDVALYNQVQLICFCPNQKGSTAEAILRRIKRALGLDSTKHWKSDDLAFARS
ncbi:MAG: hypothetical protein A3E07_02545 [Candidatus Wildermuthbacteria bacterium RIFCSPHIGHO2_12_FULL_45_9]|uniref:Uncharacterized protein n=1 Tax=Candidatus Wildermuthbacteria bacterium RIFCSPHIGHO2_02_FULL_45_25 TaxID=1802450 RepID=A0A1G2R4N3_9BACT|nr:MAG: hypothetical protein A2748_01730 [Candidatus Wildermuthbacteria bacterium RIFCSPHIGHO2_01_FULL_45_20]OHA67824.1 MAG: hypothetical protein A3C04_04255 [Candidatus Wildermuthbacteria bacterium RIFCSPHIGHO2_02_FULL_45_25]OHA71830.1 MAG: hypothetical protein A3E07_02545 [Candidatus Wildermuthbacteria bacterium RIFCSPHIGHO2_12_FULL_45_9]